MKYRPEIDGLRAIAILAVVLYHAFPTIITGGFVGVDIFFVISGFLITGLITTEISEGAFSFINFYQRRIRRIFPAFFVVILSTLILGWFILLPTSFEQLGRHIQSSSLFYSNFLLWKEAGYFDVASELKPLLHIWSLSIEEQFYLIWPIFLIVSSRRILPWTKLTFFLLFTSFLFNLFDCRQTDGSAFYLPYCRFWELLIGSATSICSPQINQFKTKITKFHTTIFATLGLLLVFLSVSLLTKKNTFPGWWAVCPTIGTALLISFSSEGNIVTKVLKSKSMVWIGLISYPLYLWHWPLLSFLHITLKDQQTALQKIAVITISAILATATYILIEKPIRRSKKISTILILLCIVGLISLSGVIIKLNQGFPRRLNNVTSEPKYSYPAIDVSYTNHPVVKKIFNSSFDSQRDIFLGSKNLERPDLFAVIGDSHAQRVYQSLINSQINNGNIFIATKGACLPFFDINIIGNGQSLHCQPLHNDVLKFIITQKNIKTVIINGYFLQYFNDNIGIQSNAGVIYDVQAKERLFTTKLDELITTLIAHHKHVIFIFDVPSFSSSVLSCVRKRTDLVTLPTDCLKPRLEHDQSNQFIRTTIRNIQFKHPSLVIIDPTNTFCDLKYCYLLKNNSILYIEDGHHLSDAGVAQLSRFFSDNFTLHLK